MAFDERAFLARRVPIPTRLLYWVTVLFLLGSPRPALGQETVTVAKEDLQTLLQLARDEKCRRATQPQLTADKLTLVVDRQGRVFASGSGTAPFTLTLDWCNYHIEAKGQVGVYAAQMPEPTWGGRFRPKAALGFLPVEALRTDVPSALDAGLLLEPFYWQYLNLNAFVGVRSVGAGLGLDVTKNLGVYTGYAWRWQGRSQVIGAVSFALW
jgi:hypothetical protein